MNPGSRITAAAAVLLSALAAPAQEKRAYTPAECPPCAEWNAPSPPVRLYGNTYWVGTRGLGAVLITSRGGHVLIDGALPESAELILANIRALGFRVEDVQLIVNSHVHYDHAGGIAAIQRASGATVAASRSSAAALERGNSGPDDPQYGILLPYPPVAGVRVIEDGDTLRVGSTLLTAHLTPGHTPGGTTWSWQSCEDGTCLTMVYADSQTPISAESFLYTRNSTYPGVLQDFERGLATLERLTCDVLITPHPGASHLWERVEARNTAGAQAVRDQGCSRYAANARRQLARRIASEGGM